ncbi:C45 family autoproteolytic acyltransferase/hydrolase [Kineococcus gynurae]|uniref:C45 family autoproteolytic acyltransferase/hydrolase n=1 Tax=Kineococcus gynurae TaxID=452979 RepID=A0ABV5LWJ6_9ACTN
MTTYPFTMFGITEARPGARWQALFDATWPAYRRFHLSEGRDARPTRAEAEAALQTHMPELHETWEQLVALTGDDDDAAVFLTQWNLPAFAPAACSQVVALDPAPALARNYDYAPGLFEQTSLSTDYRRPVLGTGDCLWGLLDGMNDAGLVVSLTFGGDRAHGEGFGIPLVLRYLLETCTDVEEAGRVLARLPIAMTYNVTLLDATGASVTAHVGPDRPAEIRPVSCATNHRWTEPVDPAHAARYRSVERLDLLGGLQEEGADADAMVAALLEAPLYTRDYAHGFGTVFTADYRPAEGTLTYRWPGIVWERRFDSPDATVDVILGDADTWSTMPNLDAPDPAATPDRPGATAAAEPVAELPADWADRSSADLAALVRAGIDELARRGSGEGFALLTGLSGHVGLALGESARRIAEQGSWAQVAALSGTTKQAAWARWH